MSAGPVTGYRLESCPECGVEVAVVMQGYRVSWPPGEPGSGHCGLMTLPGGQVLVAGMSRVEENRHDFHEHQPEGLE